jgi:hypothetical protein
MIYKSKIVLNSINISGQISRDNIYDHSISKYVERTKVFPKYIMNVDVHYRKCSITNVIFEFYIFQNPLKVRISDISGNWASFKTKLLEKEIEAFCMDVYNDASIQDAKEKLLNSLDVYYDDNIKDLQNSINYHLNNLAKLRSVEENTIKAKETFKSLAIFDQQTLTIRFEDNALPDTLKR